jgi:hypothetical protein
MMWRMSTTPPSQPPAQQPGGGYGQSPYPPARGHGGKPAKLDTSAAFEQIFQVYGSQFVTFLLLALIVFVPLAIVQGAVGASGSIGLAFVLVILQIVGTSLYTGATVEAVADMRDGKRDHSVGQLISAAAPFIFPLILAGFVFGITVLFGLVLLIVGFFVFLTWFCLYAPAIVIERQGVFASMTRSRDLVRGNGWRVFGVIVVTAIIVGLIGAVIQRVAIGADDGFVGTSIGYLLSNLITAPIFAIAVTTLFFMLRDGNQPVAPQT